LRLDRQHLRLDGDFTDASRLDGRHLLCDLRLPQSDAVAIDLMVLMVRSPPGSARRDQVVAMLGGMG
jgi:hypothetical protein